MSRRNAYRFACATISAALLVGCGPRDAAPTGPRIASPTMEVKSQPTTLDGSKVNYLPMDFDKFYDTWKENPAAAASAYSGRPNGVLISGKVASITANQTNQTILLLTSADAKDATRTVHVGILTELAGEGLKKCKVGGAVEVKLVAAGITPAEPHVVAYSVTPK